MDLRREAQRRWPVSCLQVKTATRGEAVPAAAAAAQARTSTEYVRKR